MKEEGENTRKIYLEQYISEYIIWDKKKKTKNQDRNESNTIKKQKFKDKEYW